jgi:ankyrin repeat protein/cytochrome c553
VEDAQGQTALMFAALENHADAVKVLVEGGAKVNAQSKPLVWPDFKFNTGGMIYTLQPVGGWSAAMYAARQGSIAAVRALAENGADLNLADPDGTTPLILAIVNARFDTAVALLEKGADPNRADQFGMTPLYAVVDMHTLSPLMGRPAPELTDSIDAVETARVLLRRGANPNAQLKKPIIGRHTAFQGDGSLGEGSTALARAAKSADVAMIKVLLEGGADPKVTQKDGTTPTMIAVGARGQRVYSGTASVGTQATEEDALEAVTVLLSSAIDVNAANANGQTALHNAAARGSDPIVKLLVDRGATLDAKDRLGRLPIDMARGAGGGGRGGRGGAAGQVHQSTVAVLSQAMQSRGMTIPPPPAAPATAVAPLVPSASAVLTTLTLVVGSPLVLVLSAGAGVGGVSPSAQNAVAGVSISSGVYTKAQAQRGLVAYASACEHCHGASLTGDATAEVPSLVADAFLFHWRGRTLQHLYDRMRTSMPSDAPGSLGEARYVDLVAYLLEANGFPPGAQDLDRGRLGSVVIQKVP